MGPCRPPAWTVPTLMRRFPFDQPCLHLALPALGFASPWSPAPPSKRSAAPPPAHSAPAAAAAAAAARKLGLGTRAGAGAPLPLHRAGGRPGGSAGPGRFCRITHRPAPRIPRPAAGADAAASEARPLRPPLPLPRAPRRRLAPERPAPARARWRGHFDCRRAPARRCCGPEEPCGPAAAAAAPAHAPPCPHSCRAVSPRLTQPWPALLLILLRSRTLQPPAHPFASPPHATLPSQRRPQCARPRLCSLQQHCSNSCGATAAQPQAMAPECPWPTPAELPDPTSPTLKAAAAAPHAARPAAST